MSAPLPRRDQDSSADQPAHPSAGVSRRRLLRAGAGAAPVVLSMTSLPVRATTATCSSASAWASINAGTTASQNARLMVSCGTGGTPGAWTSACGSTSTKDFSKWPASCLTSTTPKNAKTFQECIGSLPSHLSTYSTATLYDAVANAASSDITIQLAAHLAAAYLNCQSNRTPANIINVTTIQSIWSQCKSGGMFTPPNAGTQTWTIGQTIYWLKNSMVATTI